MGVLVDIGSARWKIIAAHASGGSLPPLLGRAKPRQPGIWRDRDRFRLFQPAADDRAATVRVIVGQLARPGPGDQTDVVRRRTGRPVVRLRPMSVR
jgi:hypothetical protein